MAFVTGVIGAVFGTLWTRVLLELVIVVFNIAKTLTSIDDRLKTHGVQQNA